MGGNLNFSSGNVTGNTLVGGNLLSNYSGSYSGSYSDNVAVGGNLNASAGISGGGNTNVTVWGTTTGYSFNHQRALVQGSGSFSQRVKFDDWQTSLTSLSSRLDDLQATSVVLCRAIAVGTRS